jgi:hypothetical protein
MKINDNCSKGSPNRIWPSKQGGRENVFKKIRAGMVLMHGKITWNIVLNIRIGPKIIILVSFDSEFSPL